LNPNSVLHEDGTIQTYNIAKAWANGKGLTYKGNKMTLCISNMSDVSLLALNKSQKPLSIEETVISSCEPEIQEKLVLEFRDLMKLGDNSKDDCMGSRRQPKDGVQFLKGLSDVYGQLESEEIYRGWKDMMEEVTTLEGAARINKFLLMLSFALLLSNFSSKVEQ
jgi:hypothetical protein